MVVRRCRAKNDKGRACQASPMHDSEFCVFHDPESATLIAEARRAGGTRRKREATLAIAYDFEGLETVGQIRRLAEIAASDILGEQPSLNRARALGYITQVASALYEKGVLEERVAALEAELAPRLEKERKHR